MIRIDIDDRDLRARISKIEAALGPAALEEVLGDIGQVLAEGGQRAIETGKDWEGREFAENSPTTLLRKKGSRPLIDHGDLVGDRISHEVEGMSVLIGASAIQSAALQFGAKKGAFGSNRRGAPIPSGDIPPRPYLPLTDDGDDIADSGRELIEETISDYLVNAAGP